ncbi:MAG: hypothetical protein ABEJ68_10740 [Halobacteriaceae archaeon]
MNRKFWAGIMAVLVTLTLFLFASLLFSPGPATRVVIVLSLIHIAVGMLIIGAMLYFDWDPFEPLR